MQQSYLEIIQRAHDGSQVSKSDWDFHIIDTTKEMVERYRISWDPAVITPDDPALADSIFSAGRELLLQTGVYSLKHGSVIRLTEQEIDEGIRAMNRPLTLGEGADARTLLPRKISDSRRPIIWAGNPGVPTPERLFKPSVTSWAQEPLVDLITCGSLVDIDGYRVESGEPSELLASRRELAYLREVLREVGRPGMGMLAAESSVTETGDLAATHPDLLRPCDAHLVALFNELMIDNGNMVRAANSIYYGQANASLATVMVGGLGGDAPGAAVLQVASFLAANIVCRADYHLCHPIHIRYVATSTRGCMWLQSIVCQAFARNAPAIVVCDIYPKSGALTEEVLYEVAANALAATVSGGHLEGVGSADGAYPHGTGIEVRMMAEVGHAAARGVSLREANALIQQLLERYERVFELPGGNRGVPVDQAYDFSTLQPVPQWQAMYEHVKQELAGIGLQL